MLQYVVIVLIALWVLLVVWIKYLRWREKNRQEELQEREREQLAPRMRPRLRPRPAPGGPSPRTARSAPPPKTEPLDLEPIIVSVGDVDRVAYFEEPKAPSAMPLLLCFHGGLGNAENFAETSNLSARARAHGYLAVFPAAPQGWVDGRPERGTSTEDLDFVAALIAHLTRDQFINPARIFAVGVSNGGFFVQHLATQRPGTIAAGASVLASIPTAVAETTEQAPPMPFVLACDPSDGVMPFDGGEIASGPGLGVGGHVVPVHQARSIWVRRNEAGVAGRAKRVDGPGGFWSEIYDHPAGPEGAPVRFVEIYGKGHRWPRWTGTGSAGEAVEVNAADFVLEFFASEPVQEFATRAYAEKQSVAQMGWGTT